MRRAVLVGCAAYDDISIASLKYAHKDAEALAHTLVETCGFAREEISVLTSPNEDPKTRATKSNVIRQLTAAREFRYDTVLFYFSGHGYRSPADMRDYLLPQDSVVEALSYLAIPVQDVVALLDGYSAQTKILILDACRNIVDAGKSLKSEKGLDDWDPSALDLSGHAAFFSCRPHEKSFEVDELERGIFTFAICEGLSDVGRCRNIEDLDKYLLRRVPQLSTSFGTRLQTPYTRVEPLTIAASTLVSLQKMTEWSKGARVGKELRRQRIGPSKSLDGHGILAFDFGTSNSISAVLDAAGDVQLIPAADGRTLVPTTLLFGSLLDYTVGESLARAGDLQDGSFQNNFKRLLSSGAVTSVFQEPVSPVVLASLVIRSLMKNAEEFLGEAIQKAVAAVPAGFGIVATNALAEAFKLAGVDLVRLIGEPCAAAVIAASEFSGVLPQATRDIFILVVDIGGGTTDASAVGLTWVDEETQIEVHAVAGNYSLGGMDYDNVIYDYLLRGFTDQLTDGGPALSPRHLAFLRSQAERAKVSLGLREEATVLLSDVETAMGFQSLEVTISRGTFLSLSSALTDSVRDLVSSVQHHESVVKVMALYEADGFDALVLAGQGSKIIGVRQTLTDLLPGVRVIDQFQESAVIRGLAIYGGVLGGSVSNLLLLDAFYSGIYIECQTVDAVNPMMGIKPSRRSTMWILERDGGVASPEEMALVGQLEQLPTIEVSSNSEENVRHAVILEAFTTCPTTYEVGIRFLAGQEETTLALFERVGVDPPSVSPGVKPQDAGFVLLGHIPISRSLVESGVVLEAEADGNRTVLVHIYDARSGERKAVYQVNNPWLASRYFDSINTLKTADSQLLP